MGLGGDKYGVFLKTSISFAFPNGPVPQLTKWRVGGGGHTGDGFAGYQRGGVPGQKASNFVIAGKKERSSNVIDETSGQQAKIPTKQAAEAIRRPTIENARALLGNTEFKTGIKAGVPGVSEYAGLGVTAKATPGALKAGPYGSVANATGLGAGIYLGSKAAPYGSALAQSAGLGPTWQRTAGNVTGVTVGTASGALLRMATEHVMSRPLAQKIAAPVAETAAAQWAGRNAGQFFKWAGKAPGMGWVTGAISASGELYTAEESFRHGDSTEGWRATRRGAVRGILTGGLRVWSRGTWYTAWPHLRDRNRRSDSWGPCSRLDHQTLRLVKPSWGAGGGKPIGNGLTGCPLPQAIARSAYCCYLTKQCRKRTSWAI